MMNSNQETVISKQILKTGLFFLFAVFCLLFTHRALAATLYAGSATQVVYEGQSFVVDWYLDTEGVVLNTVDLKLEFSTDTLAVTETTGGDSLISLWIKTPKFDNQKGTIELVGGIPNGFNGTQVPLFRTTFLATKTGNAEISLSAISTALKNDGQGTAQAVKFQSLKFPVVDQNLQPMVISSTTHPDQNKWYQTRSVRVGYSPVAGTDYSFSFSSNAEIFPDDAIDPSSGSFEFNSMPDGVYYFKLNSKIGASNWQEAGVYRIQIDGTAPESFVPLIGSDVDTKSGRPFLSFSTLDKTSGISHYNIKSGLLGIWKKATSPHELHKPLVGKHIKVAAVDNAGNKRIETIEYKGWLPVWLFMVLLVILLGLILLSTGVMSRVMSILKNRNAKK